MSWIIGYGGGRLKDDIINKINCYVKDTIYEISEDKLFIKAGGSKLTCFHSKDSGASKSFIAAGVGIKRNSSSFTLLDNNGWANIDAENEIKELGGHFVLAEWDKSHISLFTDQMGMRDFYFRNIDDDSFIFSTRADWIAKITGDEIDYSVFGAKWMLSSQISSGCIFENIKRIIGGSTLTVNRQNNSHTSYNTGWLPQKSAYTITNDEFENILWQLIVFPFSEGKNILLSFSGGLDSRLILSFLLKSNDKKWHVHTLGDMNHPDSVIAGKIADAYDIKHEHINTPLPDAGTYVKELEEFVLQTTINNSALGYGQLRNINQLKGREEIIIDGGCGEIWRRENFRHLLLTGKNALLQKDIKKVLSYLNTYRGNIFNEDITKTMARGCEEQLNNAFDELPGINSINVKNWVDIFAVKTLMMNRLSREQIRFDHNFICFMPLIQPFLLNRFLDFPDNKKENAKFYKQMLLNNCSDLEKFPLVKETLTYPFAMTILQKRLLRVVYKKLKLDKYVNPTERSLIPLLSEYILDILSSNSVKQCPVYNHYKLNSLFNSIRAGILTPLEKHEIYWWLSFELYRQNI
jgi:hypothetical protein